MSNLTDKDHSDEPEEAPGVRPVFSTDSPAGEGESKLAEDPLVELRKKFLAEDQRADPAAKPDFLQRVTGTIASKKTPTRPRNMQTPDQEFGVLTTRRPTFPEPATSPRTAVNAGGDDIHDDFVEMRLRVDSDRLRRNRSNVDPTKNTPDGPLPQGEDAPTLPSITKAAPPEDETATPAYRFAGRHYDPLWDGGSVEEETSPNIQPESLNVEPPSRPVEVLALPGVTGERQYQVNRYLSYNPQKSIWDQFRGFSAIEKGLILALVLAVIMVSSLIIYLYIGSRQPVVVQIPTKESPQIPGAIAASPLEVPIPVELELPGGWKFALKSSTSNGVWMPTTSEWLSGSEIRRVVGIPWNKQVEAVVRTFGPGDSIQLMLSNGDIQVFKFSSISQVDVQDLSVLRDTRPSLAIVLINTTEKTRWVVIAFP
jgi:hypothetical protein